MSEASARRHPALLPVSSLTRSPYLSSSPESVDLVRHTGGQNSDPEPDRTGEISDQEWEIRVGMPRRAVDAAASKVASSMSSRSLRSAAASSPSAASRPAKQSNDGAETVASAVPTPGTSAPVQTVAGSRKRGNSSADLRGTKKQKIAPAGRLTTVNQGARPIRVCPWKPSCNAHMMALPHFPIQALPSPPNMRIYGKSDRVPCHWRTEMNGRVTVCQRVLGLTELGRHVRGYFTETAWRCPLVFCKKEYQREDVAMSQMRLKPSDVDWDALGRTSLCSSF
ncbi:hypothetical protein B0H21DRAFT_819879 [Amylocystis lapponica]|nr:hypothetical protein B0H21DRAFT_819879 [Amylocystis lapponica]